MKQVILVRHAKSEQYGYDDDFNRALTDRGKTDAATIGSYLKEQKIVAGVIISSPARRAMQTARIFADALGYPVHKIISVNALYEGITTNDFIALLHELPEGNDTIFVFGHNPAIFYLAGNLIKFFNGDMPTCSTVGISFSISKWDQLEARQGHLSFHYTPGMFK
ncbi:MAG: histidine phosphatase family protein [Prolixibacteraceae bacterium]|jgi:phosphohistidine phosphatase|nr:histidine phosphatase family protein [Prolixibacteraceae bacterium]